MLPFVSFQRNCSSNIVTLFTTLKYVADFIELCSLRDTLWATSPVSRRPPRTVSRFCVLSDISYTVFVVVAGPPGAGKPQVTIPVGAIIGNGKLRGE